MRRQLVEARELPRRGRLDLAVGLNGGTWKFSIFGKNVTDEEFRTVEVNRNTYYNQPALYGARLTVDW